MSSGFTSPRPSARVRSDNRQKRSPLAAILLACSLAALALTSLACGDRAAPSPTPAPTTTPQRATDAAMMGMESAPTIAPSDAAPSPTPALFPLTVTDGNGRDVVFEAPPERIAAIDSAVVETLFAIGEGRRVAATHDFVSYPPEAEDIPRIGDAFNLNNEAILELEPDLVVVFSEGGVANLEQLGLKVLYLKSLNDDFRRVSDNILLWGRIVGAPDAADVVASRFDERVRRIEEAMATRGDGPSVFQDVGDLWSPGPDTLMGSVFELLKLKNIARDVSGYAQISPEVVVERRPEIIIASDAAAAVGNPAFADLPAIMNGRVFVPPHDLFSVAGPRFIDGIETLAKWVYPDLFE